MWLANHYFGEGPGIDKNTPKPEGLRLLLSVLSREWWELLKLNLLFLVFALPLVTLPAAAFATVLVTVTMVEDRNVWLFKDFWRAFLSRFWLVTGLGLIFAAAGGLCGLALVAYAEAARESLMFAAPLAVAAAVSAALPLYAASFMVALAKAGEAKFGTVLRAAAIGVFARPLPPIFALAFVLALWLVHIAFYPVSVFMPVLVNFSLGALVMSLATLEGVQLGFSRLQSRSRYRTTGKPETQSA